MASAVAASSIQPCRPVGARLPTLSLPTSADGLSAAHRMSRSGLRRRRDALSAANECGVVLMAWIAEPARRVPGPGRGEDRRVRASSAADLVRDRLGEMIFQRVAGPQGAERRRLISAP